MARRTRKPFELGLNPFAYNPTGLDAYSDEALLKEYARLRREANDRLRKLGKSEFSDTKAYTLNKDKFIPIKELSSRRQLQRLVQDAARFVTARGSSASGLRGIRRDQLSTLHANGGFGWVNTKNYKQFYEFMKEVREKSDEYSFYHKTEPGSKERSKISGELREEFEIWLAEQSTGAVG